MNFYLYAALSLTIFVAGVISLIRFPKINETYYPFVFCLWIGCINESLNIYLVINGYQTLLNNNIYALIESVLLIWFLKEGRLIKKHFIILVLSLIIGWSVETFVIRNITDNSTLFRIFSSLAIVILSIKVINRLIFSQQKHLLKSSTFLLCIAFIIYFTYTVLVQSFVIYGVDRQSTFLLNIYVIMIYVNLAVNLLYALAVLWMPKKARYISPF